MGARTAVMVVCGINNRHVIPGGNWIARRVGGEVSNLDEAIEFLTEHGFRKPRRASVSEKVDTGSSKFMMMVSPSGYIIALSEHLK
ncbi:MAG: hypothetical protein Q4A07_03535 [Coriobacteriales bacterium]|nr:hypothetical protein [Coriobacteriales bacterium]